MRVGQTARVCIVAASQLAAEPFVLFVGHFERVGNKVVRLHALVVHLGRQVVLLGVDGGTVVGDFVEYSVSAHSSRGFRSALVAAKRRGSLLA